MRKPAKPDLVPAPLQQAVNNPPYPTTPADDRQAPFPPTSEALQQPSRDTLSALELSNSDLTHAHPLRQGNHDSDSEESIDWASQEDDSHSDRNEVPSSLKAGGGKSASKPTDENWLPSALRVGPPDGTRRTPSPGVDPLSAGPLPLASNASRESTQLQSQNPFLNIQKTGQTAYNGPTYGTTFGQTGLGIENSSAAWRDVPSHPPNQPNPAQSPIELPTHKTPVDQTAALSLTDRHDYAFGESDPLSPYSRQPPLIPADSEPRLPGSTRHDSTASSSTYNPGMDISSIDAMTSRGYRLPSESESPNIGVGRTWQEQQEWERSQRERREREIAAANERALREEMERRAEEEWHRGEQMAREAVKSLPGSGPPELPPRGTQEQGSASSLPSRPELIIAPGTTSGRPEVETPTTRMTRQRREHYQIKHIRWFDARVGKIRPAPILTQNANGPCPLLALVNALVLSTPFGEETALVETLRTREQVSLGLLLDAVFDELMSGRRGGAAQELPDVGDLYTFLITLHTGMNVNPRLVEPPSPPPNIMDMVGSPHLDDHTGERSLPKPGGFEETREMRLYSTFNVPLIHGWLPEKDSRPYIAFERTAKTYEDAQNVQFREDELEDKLAAQGLSPEEQQLFEDLHNIKEFLTRWPTQLTDNGLEAMSRSLKPGQIAILFRNDHFSTLYKEPRSHQLLTLVTDAGYSSHEEIVWETLVDVNGQGSELYSGDFRPVGNMSQAGPSSTSAASRGSQQVRSMLDVGDKEGWTTAKNRRSKQRSTAEASHVTSSSSTAVNDAAANPTDEERKKAEQEDHDLALALQLQEEEEDRHRREQEERRRREERLSQQLLDQESRSQNTDGRPAIPPRRNNLRPDTVRPATEEEAPPPYDQAASGRPFVPSANHPMGPPPPAGNPMNSPAVGRRRQQSAYIAQTASQPPQQPQLPHTGRRRSSKAGQTQPGCQDDKEKCVVM